MTNNLPAVDAPFTIKKLYAIIKGVAIAPIDRSKGILDTEPPVDMMLAALAVIPHRTFPTVTRGLPAGQPIIPAYSVTRTATLAFSTRIDGSGK